MKATDHRIPLGAREVEFPERFTRLWKRAGGFRVLKVEDRCAITGLETASWAVFLPDADPHLLRALRKNEISILPLKVQRKIFRPLGIAYARIAPAEPNEAQGAIVQADSGEIPPVIQAYFDRHHARQMTDRFVLAGLYLAIFFGVFLLRERVLTNVGRWGYYALSGAVIALFGTAFYRALRHREAMGETPC